MKLNVFCSNVKIGSLDIQANEPFYGFTYDNGYLSSNEAVPISLSLPLTESRYPSEQAQPYFEGLLPEGEARDAISRRLGVPRTSSVKLLQALGRDCAGDISIIDESERTSPATVPSAVSDKHLYYPLDGGIARIAQNPREEVPRLLEDTRLSLAGGQEKIALFHDQNDTIDKGWYIPYSGAPSTHIIKPGLLEAHYPNITLNEFLCLRAAAACSIQTVNVDLLYPETPIIIIQRYDRFMSNSIVEGFRAVIRIHQEDFCQACGVKSDFKYEHDGGPGFSMIRNLLVRHAKQPIEDITMLVKWGLFNYLIGNCDAHAKNISLLHNTDGTVSLAPLYDLISTTIYDGRFGSKLSRNMGMRVGMHENIDRIKAEDFEVFAKDVRMRLQQVKIIGEELMDKLQPAFGAAVTAAEEAGFPDAGEIAGRILNGCYLRAKVLAK